MDDDALQKRIGEVARGAREGLGLTQAEVAKRAGLSAPVYGRIERGGMMPSTPTLRRLTVALSVPADALLDVTTDEVPNSYRELPPGIQKVVGLIRGWSEAKLRVVLAVLRALEPTSVADE
jgi:transcriptional regulator with XRE-family HTH domain